MRPSDPAPHWPNFGLGMAPLPHKTISVHQLTALMEFAMQQGVKLFDTAANYHEGQAELSLADAMARQRAAFQPSAIADVTVVIKIGQLTQIEYDRRTKSGVSHGRKHWDFSKTYLSETLYRSVERLNAAAHKYVLLHNPEEAMAAEGHGLSALDDAFSVLEDSARSGLINAWGLASWSGLYATAGTPEHIDLATLLDRLDASLGEHHFKIIQAPMGLWNLHKFNSATQKRREDGQPLTLAGFCQDQNLQLMLNAAFDGGRWSPQCAEDPELREFNRADILQLCNEIAPTACRIVGASQTVTIESLIGIYHD